MKALLCCTYLFLFLFGVTGTAQDLDEFQKKEFKNADGSMPYRVLLPKEFDKSKEYPLLLFLHGAGERGDDNEAQLTHGADLFIKDEIRKKYPAIVAFPQCPKDSYWSNVDVKRDSMPFTFTFSADGEPTKAMKLVKSLLKDLLDTYKIDENRIYVGGLSMGGMGTFELVRRNPDTFAAAFAICGGAHPDTAEQIAGIPWWVFHGDADVVVDFKHSKKMVKALKEAKGDVKFTVYEGVNHNSWKNAFAEPELVPWLFSHSK